MVIVYAFRVTVVVLAPITFLNVNQCCSTINNGRTMLFIVQMLQPKGNKSFLLYLMSNESVMRIDCCFLSLALSLSLSHINVRTFQKIWYSKGFSLETFLTTRWSDICDEGWWRLTIFGWCGCGCSHFRPRISPKPSARFNYGGDKAVEYEWCKMK